MFQNRFRLLSVFALLPAALFLVLATGGCSASGQGTVPPSVLAHTAAPSEASPATVPRDMTPPVLTLLGDAVMLLDYEDSFREPGFKALDDVDGDLSARVTREEAPQGEEGDILYTYRVKDAAGNEASATRLLRRRDLTAPELILLGDEELFLEKWEDFKDPGFMAWDERDGNLTLQVVVEEALLFASPGKQLSYRVQDASGNRVQAQRIIHITDCKAPALLLSGQAEYVLDPEEVFEEPGFSATDDWEGDITSLVQISHEISENGDRESYLYTVTDSSGNTASATRIIYRRDVTAPLISLNGEEHITLDWGESFQDPGASARDDREGDISGRIQVEGAVSSWQAGQYTLIYRVADAAGNTGEVRRTVTVKEKPQPETTAPPATQPAAPASGSRIVYLTFDDGPFQYTERLLDILARYNVKVTFFVTSSFPTYFHLIGRAASEGHTVGLHTASHRYEYIYQSESNYFSDLAAIEQVVSTQTGQKPWLLRFPGGSSNTVSASYNQGIMSRLAREVQARGYRYMDWNVSSGDGADQTRDAVYRNVINGISQRDISMVLMHDIKSETVEAVESIIQWCLNNGYTLLPITPDTPDIHHGIYN